jgi:two-component system, OmpR family, KDP operon response regulator KdpE
MANKYLILMIEDEKPIRRFLKPYLENHDFKVIEAENAQEGLGLASSHKPDIILLDLGLPDLDGWCFSNASGNGPRFPSSF